jgi:hypothetical protein
MLPNERLEQPVTVSTAEALEMLACLTLAGQVATILHRQSTEDMCRRLCLVLTEKIGLDIAEIQRCHDLLTTLED